MTGRDRSVEEELSSSFEPCLSLKGLNVLANIQQRVLTHIDGDIYGVAAYYTDNDRIQHAVVATKDGSLYEIHWSTGAAASSPQKLTHFNGLDFFGCFFLPDNTYLKG